MKYTKFQYVITFTVGILIAFSGVPSSVKDNLPMPWAWELGASVLLGGLYAIEKLQQSPTHPKDQDVTITKDDKVN